MSPSSPITAHDPRRRNAAAQRDHTAARTRLVAANHTTIGTSASFTANAVPSASPAGIARSRKRQASAPAKTSGIATLLVCSPWTTGGQRNRRPTQRRSRTPRTSGIAMTSPASPTIPRRPASVVGSTANGIRAIAVSGGYTYCFPACRSVSSIGAYGVP